jgi:hypothetical protein
MAFTPQNFVNLIGPPVSAAWLNGVDVTCNSALNGAQTAAQVLTALGLTGLASPVPVTAGGTGATSAAAGLAALGGTTLAAAEAAINPYPVQTAAEITAGVTPTNYAYAPGNVLRYGTNTNPGVTDMTNAIQSSASQSLMTTGAPVYIPQGIYTISSAITFNFLNISGAASVRVYGDGSDETIINQATSATNGLAFNFLSSSNSVHIRDMTLAAASADSGSNGIILNQTAPLGDAALSDITNITFRGSDGYGVTDCWSTGILSAGVSNINITNCAFWGSGTRDGEGIIAQGTVTTPPVVFNIIGCTFDTLNVGFNYGNYVQGVTINQSNFTGCGTGIFCASSLAGLDELIVSNSQFECYTNAISINTLLENCLFIGNLFLVGIVNNGSGIDLGVSGQFSIIGNSFNPQSVSTTGNVGIVINGYGGLPGVITGNVIEGMNVGIALLSGAQYVNVQSNAYARNTTNVSNAGSNNTIGGGSP